MRAPAPRASVAAPPPPIEDRSQRARELAERLIILDGHIDAPYRLEQSRNAKGELTDDIVSLTKKGNFDFDRARAGGLDVPFMSIYVPSRYGSAGAKRLAEKLIRLVESYPEKYPEKFGLARSPADVARNTAQGRISLAMGMENGSPIGLRLENVGYFQRRGIRYITLTHFKDNLISDSATDPRRTHHGLSSFGKRVVKEMNRVGIMVDVSHISDEAFWQVLTESSTPVIASHSSCRHFTPDFPRNMSDEMIVALARAGGVIQINFGSAFLDPESRQQQNQLQTELTAELAREKIDPADPRARPIRERLLAARPIHHASVAQVADHIDHVVRLVGISHAGLGSDFDGVGDTLPTELSDVSQYPNLIRVLLERGYTDEQIEAICSGNVLRVWQKAEDFAHAAQSGL